MARRMQAGSVRRDTDGFDRLLRQNDSMCRFCTSFAQLVG
jgi:hypothetical protein